MSSESLSPHSRLLVRTVCWASLLFALSAPWWCERPSLLRPFAVPMIAWVACTKTLSRSVLVGTLAVAFGTFRSTWTSNARDEAMVEFVMLSIVSLLAFVVRRQFEIRQKAERTDSLTGIANRASCVERLTAELERAKRNKQPLAISFWDCDQFKQLNDTHGHIAGDRTLRSIASSIAADVRSYDILARWGGDEFVLVLPETSHGDATAVIDRLKTSVVSDEEVGVSLTVGLVVFDGDSTAYPATAMDAIHAADQAMYQEKQSAEPEFAGPNDA